jgi:hypothetical protein
MDLYVYGLQIPVFDKEPKVLSFIELDLYPTWDADTCKDWGSSYMV